MKKLAIAAAVIALFGCDQQPRQYYQQPVQVIPASPNGQTVVVQPQPQYNNSGAADLATGIMLGNALSNANRYDPPPRTIIKERTVIREVPAPTPDYQPPAPQRATPAPTPAPRPPVAVASTPRSTAPIPSRSTSSSSSSSDFKGSSGRR